MEYIYNKYKNVNERKEEEPVAKKVMEPNNEILFVVGDVAALNVGPEIVQPSQPAALATSLQACILGVRVSRGKTEEEGDEHIYIRTSSVGEVSPSAFAVGLNVRGQQSVFHGGPGSSIQSFLGATWTPPHFSLFLSL